MIAAGMDSPLKKSPTKLLLEDVVRLWPTELRTSEIAEKLEVTTARLQSFARAHNLPRRAHIKPRPPSKIVDPTPEEIKERAAACRARRTEAEHNRLQNYKEQPVEVYQYNYNPKTGIFTGA